MRQVSESDALLVKTGFNSTIQPKKHHNDVMKNWGHSLTALKRPFVGTDFHGHISGFNF